MDGCDLVAAKEYLTELGWSGVGLSICGRGECVGIKCCDHVGLQCEGL